MILSIKNLKNWTLQGDFGDIRALFQTGQKSLYGALLRDLGRFSISFQVEEFDSEMFKECFDKVLIGLRLRLF